MQESQKVAGSFADRETKLTTAIPELESDYSTYVQPIQPVQREITPPAPKVRLWSGRSAWHLLAVGLGLGFAAQLLFYKNSLGISVLLFVSLALVSVFGLSLTEKVKPRWLNLWLIGPLLFFAVMIAVRANAVLTVINLGMILVLLGLLIYFYHADELERLTLFDYPLMLLLSAGRTLEHSADVIGTAWETKRSSKGVWKTAAPILRGILLAVPVLLVFTILLSSADSVFEKYVSDVFKLNPFKNLDDLLNQAVIFTIIGFLAIGALSFSLARRSKETVNVFTLMPPIRQINRSVGFTEVIIVMGLVTLLFAAFDAVQFANLFAGQTASKMDLIAYQTYARRGFGELLVAAVFALGFILGLNWLARCQTKGQTLTLKILGTILIGLLGIILVSAFQRMVMWEQVPDYLDTGLRVYVRSFIIWLAVGFGWLAITMWWKPERFALGAFGALIGFAITLNIANPDATVASGNLGRFDDNPRYVSANIITPGLSEDAIPALAQKLRAADNPRMTTFLKEFLTNELSNLERQQKREGWPSFHFARYQAYEELKRLREQGYLKP